MQKAEGLFRGQAPLGSTTGPAPATRGHEPYLMLRLRHPYLPLPRSPAVRDHCPHDVTDAERLYDLSKVTQLVISKVRAQTHTYVTPMPELSPPQAVTCLMLLYLIQISFKMLCVVRDHMGI